MALRIANSPVRSRTEIAMVLPVTRSRVKKTTLPITRIRNSMLPNCFTQPAAKADSVSVFVSYGELEVGVNGPGHAHSVIGRIQLHRNTSRSTP